MKTDVKGLLKTKTFWAGITGIVGALSGYFTGAMAPDTAIEVGVLAIMSIFLRDGQLKAPGKPGAGHKEEK
jgi:hypothetical protein